MISADRLLPQQEIYNFLRSITIKYDPMVHYVNQMVIDKGYAVNDSDPTTWKYYINLTGAYHASDTRMYVTSLDTRQQILFSPATLAVNLRTRQAYLPGSDYYKRLCETYPEQVDLIKSILFPVPDMTSAIAAKNLTLLGYGSGILEPAEEPILVMEIESFLAVIKERWYFNFLDDEPYFYITFWSCLFIHLAMLLMSCRVANIQTPYVHSWDIWNKLESKGVSNYSDILNRQKSMVLYQNIDYLKQNSGKESNLIFLVNRLLYDFGVALYGRMVVQEAETGAQNYQLTPQLVPIQIPTNTADLGTEIATETVATIQQQLYQAGLTLSDSPETITAVERALSDTTLNNYMTKFLEIRPIAMNKPYADLLNMFIIETLMLTIGEGYYAQPVNIVDPVTNNILYLTPQALLGLYNYATNKAVGVTPTLIPTSMRLFLSFTPEIATPSLTIPWQDELIYLSMYVDTASYLSGLSYNTTMQSPDDFTTNLTALWLKFMEHLLADESTEIEQAHVSYMYLSSLCHSRREQTLNIAPGFTDYATWLGITGLDLQTNILSQYALQPDPAAAWSNLADIIITALVPINDVLNTFGNFTLNDTGYNRLTDLFVQMCSYRVVFLNSNRQTDESIAGAKWSTNYSPVTFHSYEDDITTEVMRFQTTMTVTQPLELVPDIHADPIVTFSTHQTYTETFVSQPVSSLQAGELPVIPIKTNPIPSTTVSLLNTDMHYVAMGVEFIPPLVSL